MSSPKIERAMILAAGRGQRLRPLTDRQPKPLIMVNGRCLLDRILDRLIEYGIKEIILNIHYLADQIIDHLTHRDTPVWRVMREETLLETGGGVKHALPYLGDQPFFVINGDILWQEGNPPILDRLTAKWDPLSMDGLLVLHSVTKAFGYEGGGDFFLDEQGLLRRREKPETAPYVFTGIQILHPRLFQKSPPGAFSINLLFDTAIQTNRLRGLVHSGQWFHVGTPDHLRQTASILADEEGNQGMIP